MMMSFNDKVNISLNQSESEKKGKISGYIRKQEINHAEGSANQLRELHLIESSKILLLFE